MQIKIFVQNDYSIHYIIVSSYTGCHYPTFYDFDNGQCVMTCPNGTYGVVYGASMNHTRNCTISEDKN